MSYTNSHHWCKLNRYLSQDSALAPDKWRRPNLDYRMSFSYYQAVNLHLAHSTSDVSSYLREYQFAPLAKVHPSNLQVHDLYGIG